MHLLIVEDDDLMRDLLRTLALSIDEHLKVVEADTVEEALSLWQKNSIDLILCDWHLPGTQDGIDLVRQIRMEDSDIPVLMITPSPIVKRSSAAPKSVSMPLSASRLRLTMSFVG